MAGPEFAPKEVPGVLGVNYKFPSPAQIIRYRNLGFNSIRLPILWERVQPRLFESLDEAYIREIRAVLDVSEKYGMTVLLDLHNYGKYQNKVVGLNDGVQADALADVWARLAQSLSYSHSLTGYGLMNEPNHPSRVWHGVAQKVVEAIRKIDNTRTIYVAGDGWSAAERWQDANPRPFVSDPSHNIIYEAHLYLDDDASGRYMGVAPNQIEVTSRLNNRLAPFLLWLKKFNVRGGVGEFGVPSDGLDWMQAVPSFYALVTQQCIPSYYWGGGAFSPSNVLSIEPKFGRERMIIPVLRESLKAAARP